jgi:4-amino-4-deoxy-L-arabinose transferase-like glycosyltransferase
MIYIKSIIAGLAALVMFAVIFAVVSSIALNWDMPAGSAATIDVFSWAKQASNQSRYQLIAVLVFGIGFFSKYRRVPK